MSFYYLLLLLSTSLPVSYIVFRQRQFDLLSVYTLLLLLFSIPIYFGLMYEPYSQLFLDNAIEDEVFVIYSIPYIFVFFSLVYKDSLNLTEMKIKKQLYNRRFSFLCASVCCMLFVSYIPDFVSATTKVEMLESVDFRFVILTSLVPVGFYYSLINKDMKYVIFFVFIMFLLFMFGTRRPFALCMVIFIMQYFRGKKFYVYKKYKLILLSVTLISVVILGKTFYSYFLNYGLIGIVFWWDNFTINMLLTGSEFMSTSVILNEIVKNKFMIDIEIVPLSLVAITPIPLSLFGFSSSVFNDLFQPALFSEIKYGMAYNPWAEAYSWFSFPGVFLYSFLIPSSILRLEVSAYKNSKSPMGAIYFVSALLLAVWVHRSSMGSELAYIRNIIYPTFFIYALSLLIYIKKGVK